MTNQNEKQLTFDVVPHPKGPALIGASLKVSLDVGVDVDLNQGDELRIVVSGADGEVIAMAKAEVVGVGFAPVKIKQTIIGTERVHKAKAEEVED